MELRDINEIMLRSEKEKMTQEVQRDISAFDKDLL